MQQKSRALCKSQINLKRSLSVCFQCIEHNSSWLTFSYIVLRDSTLDTLHRRREEHLQRSRQTKVTEKKVFGGRRWGGGGWRRAGFQRNERCDGEERRQIPPSCPVREWRMKGRKRGGRRGRSGVCVQRCVQPLNMFVWALIVCLHVWPVRVHVSGVFDLAVQSQTVPPLSAVRAKVAGERPLPRVHTHVFHQLVGCPR